MDTLLPQRIPFIIYVIGHVSLLIKQIVMRVEAPLIVNLPLFLLTFGCAIDNLRLSIGVCQIGKSLTYLSFFLHLVALPTLIPSIIQIILDFFPGLEKWRTPLTVFGGLIALALCLDGLYQYSHYVSGKLIPKQASATALPEYGIIKSPSTFLLGVIAISIFLLICGVLWWKHSGDYSVFLVQLICFIGQALTPILIGKIWSMQAMNVFEVIVIANILWLIDAVYIPK